MPLDDLPAGRQADPRAFVLASTVKALKDRKNLISILVVESYPVVGNRQPAQFRVRSMIGIRNELCIDSDHGFHIVLAEFEGIADQVLQ